MDLILVCLYIKSLFFAILIIWFLYQVLKKKRWVRWERTARDMKDFIKRNEKKNQCYFKSNCRNLKNISGTVGL